VIVLPAGCQQHASRTLAPKKKENYFLANGRAGTGFATALQAVVNVEHLQ
jgi:hypothetical protein